MVTLSRCHLPWGWGWRKGIDDVSEDFVTVEKTPPEHVGDVDFGSPVSPPVPAGNGEFVRQEAAPEHPYRPIAQAPSARGAHQFSRRIRRLTETHEIRIRTTHRRRKVLARGGVLAGFGLAMVVYPIMGNVVEYHAGVETVPGVVVGETPTTGHALLGDGPSLVPTVIELPSVADQTQALAVASSAFTTSTKLPGCNMPAQFSGENGQLSTDQLCELWDGNYMRADAALVLAELNAQFNAKFGRDLCIQEGYRSYADQVRIRGLRGYLAASPGTSMHGFGVAFDLCSGDDSGAPKAWLDENAAAFNFVNPDWAKYRKYEPWHWEYKPGVDDVGLYGEGYWSYGAPDGGSSDAGTSGSTGSTAPAATTPAPAPEPIVTPAPEPAEPEVTRAP
ncbi:M15 family metallopeptidase [Demequina sp. TTPB684]|uniref:M15 family metallopeptidase n=1 Tax=unclassified Demequina TaxID=2620311 RepID=UPI001CF2B908|nr:MULTISPECIES: M15 family metallopeptidase [unclassified Demequina]MCB2411631.1 M15 family metallopeptidase [Demequina sp. TTPB684]UPU88599.1 M15 family metallopeptidase [Demequina sp. TMPB413]